MRRALGALLIFAACWVFSGFTTKRQWVQKGNAAFAEKKYQTALDYYKQAQIKSPDSSLIRYDVGNALYELRDYRAAEQSYDKIIRQKPEDKTLLAKTLYNYGNVQYRLGQFEKAAEAYKKALALNPDDKDAKYNLEVLEKMKKAFDQKHSQRQKQDQKSQQKKQPSQGQQEQEQGGGQDQQDQQQSSGGQGQQGDQQKKDQQEQPGDLENEQEKKEEEQREKQQQEQPSQSSEQESAQQDQQQEQREDQKESEEQKADEKDEPKQDEPQDTPDNSLTPYELSQMEAPQAEGLSPDQSAGQKLPVAAPQGQANQAGQISEKQAMQILNALYESEREVLNTRRPPVKPREKQVEKDW